MCWGLGSMGCSFGGKRVVRRVPVCDIHSSLAAEAHCAAYTVLNVDESFGGVI